MQTINNPYNPNFSILVIQTNCENLLNKNLFTRKVIIPFYFNGHHPYWNNQALAYIDGKFYGVYEWDKDMKAMHLKTECANYLK